MSGSIEGCDHGALSVPDETPRVLVVDDNLLNAKLLRLALEERGYVVMVADSADAAREMLSHGAPAIALLDVHMPGTDGLTLLREMRAGETGVRVPVIVVSAFAAGEDLDRAYAAGADAFIAKPVNIRTLLRMVHALVTGGVSGESA